MTNTGRFADVAVPDLPDLQGERLARYRRTLAELDPDGRVGRVGRAEPTPLLFQSPSTTGAVRVGVAALRYLGRQPCCYRTKTLS